MPPPWMSKCSPRISRAIAEHSMCQPGRPLPHGLSQPGSPRLGGLPEREVERVALALADVDARAGASRSSIVAVRELAVAGKARTAKYTPWRSSTTYAAPFATSSAINACICGMNSVARGISSGRRTLSRSISSQ